MRVQNVGFEANIIENHDEPRGVSRFLPDYAQNADGAKMLGTVSVLLRGIPFIYQGQEIGMQNARWNSVDEFDDISTKDQYRVAREAGLSDAEALAVCSVMSRTMHGRRCSGRMRRRQATSGTPWLKVNDNYPVINVEKRKSSRIRFCIITENLSHCANLGNIGSCLLMENLSRHMRMQIT